jgi:hypothetical protein
MHIVSQVRFGRKPRDKFIVRPRHTISLSRGFSTSFCYVNVRPGRPITSLRGNWRALTKCDLAEYIEADRARLAHQPRPSAG